MLLGRRGCSLSEPQDPAGRGRVGPGPGEAGHCPAETRGSREGCRRERKVTVKDTSDDSCLFGGLDVEEKKFEEDLGLSYFHCSKCTVFILYICLYSFFMKYVG